MEQLTLHISPCPNDTFMFDALINGRINTYPLQFKVEYHDIEELNKSALDGRADISKISCAILPAITQTYSLLNSGAALGRGNGPLFVRRKGETTPIKRVAIPGVNTTAAALIKRLFPEVTELTPVLFSQIATKVKQGEFDAGVLIHEGRFLYHQQNLDLVADLGLLWEEKTGLPLPLGAIVIKNNLSQETKSKVEELIKQSVEYALKNPKESLPLIKQHAQELDDDVIAKHINLFVNQYSVALDSIALSAIDELVY